MKIKILPFIFLLPLFANAQVFLPDVNGLIYSDSNALASAWGDYNNDGFQDLFIVEQQLFTNDDGNGFVELANGDIQSAEFGISATWGDYDNDGFLDLHTAGPNEVLGDIGSQLFHNNGDGTFSNIDEAPFNTDINDFQGGSWVDIENDGDLDLYVACGGNVGFRNNALYVNNGDGTFELDTESNLATDSSGSVNAVWSDYDLDGDMDVFISNSAPGPEYIKNLFYINNGNGDFELQDGGPIDDDQFSTLGGSWGDYNNDGYTDFFVSNVESNQLYQNNGNGTFTSVIAGEITSTDDFSAGSGWADYDNDGDLDLLVSSLGALGNALFRNDGNGVFERQFMEIFSDFGSLGCSWADIDNDGDQDALFTFGNDGHNTPYINQGNDNNWVNIACTGVLSNSTAIGTKVWLYATIDGQPVQQLREITGQTGVLGQSDMRAHFGLGETTTIDSVRFEWPSGIIQLMENVPINQHMMVVEDTATVSSVSIIDSPLQEISIAPNPTTDFVEVGFILSKSMEINVQVLDISGRVVKTDAPGVLPFGENRLTLNLTNLSSGTYFIRMITSGGNYFTKRVIVE